METNHLTLGAFSTSTRREAVQHLFQHIIRSVWGCARALLSAPVAILGLTDRDGPHFIFLLIFASNSSLAVCLMAAC